MGVMIEANQLMQSLKQARILVIGDLMLDHYLFGHVRRISPEAPVPVVEAVRDQYLLGGAANVASNLVDLGVQTSLMAMMGTDEPADRLESLLKARGIDTSLILRCASRPTTVKTRILAGNQQMLRLDREEISLLRSSELFEATHRIQSVFSQFDAIIVSDYGKGFLSVEMLNAIRTLGQSHQGIPVVVDPKARTFERYAGFAAMTPNQLEAETASGAELEHEGSILDVGRSMRRELGLECLVITLGRRGMLVVESEREVMIPARAREVYDVTGAGDTVISVLTATRACGLSWEMSARLANGAAGIVVGKLGAATVSREEFEWVIQTLEQNHPM